MNLSIINRFSIKRERGTEQPQVAPTQRAEQPQVTPRDLQLAIAKRRHLVGDGPKIAA
jgi:hypothetical protein